LANYNARSLPLGEGNFFCGRRADEKSCGPEHPDVARDLNNLAELLQATNRLEEAEPLMRRAVTILLTFTRKMGYEHPHLRAILSGFPTSSRTQKKTKKGK
jgi:hypothetical protein